MTKIPPWSAIIRHSETGASVFFANIDDRVFCTVVTFTIFCMGANGRSKQGYGRKQLRYEHGCVFDVCVEFCFVSSWWVCENNGYEKFPWLASTNLSAHRAPVGAPCLNSNFFRRFLSISIMTIQVSISHDEDTNSSIVINKSEEFT